MTDYSKATGFMAELDRWAERTIIDPLGQAFAEGDGDDLGPLVARIKRDLREKVLESYRNGQQAGPRKEYQTLKQK